MKRITVIASALCFALGAFNAVAEDKMGHDAMGKPQAQDKMGRDAMGKPGHADKMDKMDKPGAM